MCVCVCVCVYFNKMNYKVIFSWLQGASSGGRVYDAILSQNPMSRRRQVLGQSKQIAVAVLPNCTNLVDGTHFSWPWYQSGVSCLWIQ